MTVKEWRDNNPNLDENIRVLHSVVLANLEILNAEMIINGLF